MFTEGTENNCLGVDDFSVNSVVNSVSSYPLDGQKLTLNENRYINGM